ncbi:hypothetical protein CONPUDRAFT_42793, partial [Coniophora puteana RWD-64-598 SS2]
KRGNSLMIDGLHIAQRPRWHKNTNTIIGLCREHTKGLDLGMNNMDAVLEIARAVQDDPQTCHYGREATIAVIGPFQRDNYHPFPVLVSPTCKAEKSDEFSAIISMIIAQWDEFGKPFNGPLWCVCTDGDTTFRGALHRVLMDRTVAVGDELYNKLAPLLGLDLHTGVAYIVIGPDPKHIFKR